MHSRLDVKDIFKDWEDLALQEPHFEKTTKRCSSGRGKLNP